jgi:hypothetical protein
MEEMAKQIVDKRFGAGDKVLKEGVKTEPCLFFVRKGAVIRSTSDGKFNQTLGAGRYFGVKQLLSPKDSKKSSLEKEGNKPCLCGVLPLNKVQLHLDNQFDDDSVITNAIIKKRQQRRSLVQSTVEFRKLKMLYVLGDGQFGEVWLVEATVEGEKEMFALKRQSKFDNNLQEIKGEITITQALNNDRPLEPPV